MAGERRTRLPDGRTQPRFAGVATFCRFPAIEQVGEGSLPVDWALYGVPFDGGTTFRPGARFGPRAIRDASQYIKPYHPELDVDIAAVLSMADAGDAPTAPYSCRKTMEAVTAHAVLIGDRSHTKLLAVGGDHSIALANMKATWERLGRPKSGLAVVHFDAHLDTVDEVWGERYGHASPFARAIEDGIVDPSRMLSVGIRGPLNERSDLDAARARGITIVPFDQWRGETGRSAAASFVEGLGDDETYLSFDVDCVDPAFAPGTGTPVCGGFTSAEVLAALRRLRGVNLVGADVVEVLPDRDPQGTTALLAAHVILEILALAAARARA